MCDLLEFKLYSPFNKGEGWVQGYIDDYLGGMYDLDYFYSRLALGYDVNLAILINGVEIHNIFRDVLATKYYVRKDAEFYYPADIVYKKLTDGCICNRNITHAAWVRVKEDEKFVYWHVVYYLYDDSKERKYCASFKFAREQYYEALGHLQQLIGKDIDKSQFTKPLLIERLKTQLCRLKKQKMLEELGLAEKQAYKKFWPEIEEKLKQAEENGTDVIGAFELGKQYRDHGDNHNAYLWFSTAAILGKCAVRSNPGDKEQDTCDRIKFELIYYDHPLYDECLGTKISVNGRDILDILNATYDSDQYNQYRYPFFKPDELTYLFPDELYERLTQNLGFIEFSDCYGRKAMPFWEDGGTVRNIMINAWTGLDCEESVVVAEKQDEKFVYWNIVEPVILSFKFAKEQYYYALAEFVKENLIY